MTFVRDTIAQLLWRGHDPWRMSRHPIGRHDLPSERPAGHRFLTETVERLRPAVIVAVGAGDGARVVQVASQMRELAIDGVVIAVDTWLPCSRKWLDGDAFDQADLFDIFADAIRHARLESYVVPLRLDLLGAARVLKARALLADVVHLELDRNHDHDATTFGFRQWWSILKPGGVMIAGGRQEDEADMANALEDFAKSLGALPIERMRGVGRVAKPLVGLPSAASEAGGFMLIAHAASEWREARRIEFTNGADDGTLGFSELVDLYIRFGGPTWNAIRFRIIDRIVKTLNEYGIKVGRWDVFGPDFEIRAEMIRSWLPDTACAYLQPAPLQDVAQFELLPPSPNPYAAFALPPRINKHMATTERPALTAYRLERATLFVTPLGYQLFDREKGIYWSAASTRAYADEALQGPAKTLRQPVVIVQDVFEGTNFSHFLFDWVPRLVHFVHAGRENRDAYLFLLGGIPGDFHALVLDRLCQIHGLHPEQFIFPTGPELWHIEAGVYFFSDLKAQIMHPAHMAHEQSIRVIRDIASGVVVPRDGARKIYISRADAALRRVANEDEICARLRPLGFVMVRLAVLSLAEQIRTVRSARIIIAPHGMGLTHIAFHTGGLLLIELHNPQIGTDAYAFIACALRFTYRAVFGTAMEGGGDNFVVDPDDIIKTLIAEEGALEQDAAGALAPSEQIRTHWHAGMQQLPAMEAHDVPPPAGASIACKHVRDDPPRNPDNNLGWIEAAPTQQGGAYRCACDIWIPSAYKGGAVKLQCKALHRPVSVAADLDLREAWQTISIAGTATEPACNFVLRADARAGDVIYSSRWRIRAGDG